MSTPHTVKRSAPTLWVGGPIKTVGTRIYYASAMFEGTVYNVWDTVLLNSDADPLPMGRIVSMWEQAKKKRLTVEWFYRGEDVERACLEHSKPKEEESVGVTLEPPSKKRKLEDSTEATPTAVAEALDYLSKKHSREIFSSGHKDDNYPSTLNRKITVTHISQVPNPDEYLQPDFYFFKKQVDLTTLELKDAELYTPTAEEAIDYDRKATRKRNKVPFSPTPRRPSVSTIRNSNSGVDEKETVWLKKSHFEEFTRARKALLDTSTAIGVPSALWSAVTDANTSVEIQLKELENTLENQCNSLLDALRKLDSKQEENNELYHQVQQKLKE